MNNTTLLSKYGKYMLLRIYVNSSDNELREKYAKAIEEHNSKIENDSDYIDAGFDLFSPNEYIFNNTGVNKINFNVVCSAKMIQSNSISVRYYNTGYYMYSRSSISKTKLRLANKVGIIDAGYRGELIGAFDLTDSREFVGKFDRLLQICAPDLCPIVVEMVSDKSELGTTVRGDGGFGSTGK